MDKKTVRCKYPILNPHFISCGFFYLKNTGKTHRTFGVILEELLVRTFSKDDI
ncbi:unnamed protein product [Haemophilus influenzae 10810]|nr:unnamed protein product [Haemophilus influenzae 10810]